MRRVERFVRCSQCTRALKTKHDLPLPPRKPRNYSPTTSAAKMPGAMTQPPMLYRVEFRGPVLAALTGLTRRFSRHRVMPPTSRLGRPSYRRRESLAVLPVLVHHAMGKLDAEHLSLTPVDFTLPAVETHHEVSPVITWSVLPAPRSSRAAMLRFARCRSTMTTRGGGSPVSGRLRSATAFMHRDIADYRIRHLPVMG